MVTSAVYLSIGKIAQDLSGWGFDRGFKAHRVFHTSTPACLVYSGVVGAVQLPAKGANLGEATLVRGHNMQQRPRRLSICARKETHNPAPDAVHTAVYLLHLRNNLPAAYLLYDRVYGILPIVVSDFNWDVPTCRCLQDGVMPSPYGRQSVWVGRG